MGTPKHLIEAGGRTFIECIVEVAQAVAPEIAVLGQGDLPEALRAIRRIDDAPNAKGPMAGLLAALRADRDCAWLLVGCDMPRVTPEALRWLVGQRSIEHAVVMPRTTGNRVQPLLAVFEPTALELVESLAARGTHALRALIDSGRALTPTAPPELVDAWTNVNDPGELAIVRESLAAPRSRRGKLDR